MGTRAIFLESKRSMPESTVQLVTAEVTVPSVDRTRHEQYQPCDKVRQVSHRLPVAVECPIIQARNSKSTCRPCN